AEFVSVNLGDGSDETLEERFFGHFQAEEGDGHASTDGNVFSKVKRESSFSLRRPSREDEQFGILQAGKELVELHIAGGNAGDAFTFAEYFFEALEIVADDVLDGNEAGFDAVFGDGEDGGFGAVEDGVGALFAFESALLNVVCGVDEVAE